MEGRRNLKGYQLVPRAKTLHLIATCIDLSGRLQSRLLCNGELGNGRGQNVDLNMTLSYCIYALGLFYLCCVYALFASYHSGNHAQAFAIVKYS